MKSVELSSTNPLYKENPKGGRAANVVNELNRNFIKGDLAMTTSPNFVSLLFIL
jgi:hypothetical protein